MRFSTLLAAAGAAQAYAAAPMAATNLLTEYVDNPIVTDSLSPRFFWAPQSTDRGVTQQSYRIMVNDTSAGASTTVWDSGVVASSETIHIPYAGAALHSDGVYTWSVQWTDNTGATAPWSTPAKFGTGLLTNAEWSSAAWIGCPLKNSDSDPSYTQLRNEFNLQSAATITQARLYISAVGYYSIRVNGDWAPQWGTGRPRLDPVWTTYEMTAYYNAYDLTSVLVPNGPNAIAITLGNGWPDISPVPGNNSYASVGAIPTDEEIDELVKARLTGSIAPSGLKDNVGQNRQVRAMVIVHTSDGNSHTWITNAGGWEESKKSQAANGWMCGAGAQLYDSVYNGATYDATQETTGWDLPNYSYSSGNWTSAVLRADPGGSHPTTMRAQTVPAITVQTEFPAQSVASPSPGVYVFDFGQNLAGVVRLVLPAPVPAGVTITMRHAELLMHPPYGPQDGNIYVDNLRSAKATDVYTTKGTEDGSAFEIYEPAFTYHGFRYVEVTGLPFPPSLQTVTALHMRTNVPVAGSVVFPFDNGANILNSIQHVAFWSMSNNLMGVLSDCPQRDERKGWMGDAGLSLQAMSYNFGMGALHTSFANSMRDSQQFLGDNHPAGTVADTTPHTFGSFPADPSWGTAYPGMIYTLWRMQGDTRIAADHYPNLQQYTNYLSSQINGSTIAKLWQYYGDWCPPYAMPPKGYTSAISALNDLQRMIEIATALGKTADAAMYTSYRNGLIADFNQAFLNATSGIYGSQDGGGLQTANAAAIYIGAAAAAGTNAANQVANALVNDVINTHNSHFSTGIIGMRFLHAALTAVGAGKSAVDTLLQTTWPAIGAEVMDPYEPATALWELLDGSSQGPGMNSRSHHMFASYAGWLQEELGGITQRRTNAGFNPSDPTHSGFRHPVLFPRITNHPNVSYVEAEYESVSGRYAISWINPNGTSGSSNCVTNAPENAPAVLTCPPGTGVFTKVVFASFGTPTGTCGNFQVGSCNAANSTAIVQAACIGKSTCSIDVSDTLFGDPCFNTVKHFSAYLTCDSNPGVNVMVTVPTNGHATVRLPLSTSPATATISEGSTVIFQNGNYVPGVAGITSAVVGTQDLPVGMSTIDVEVGSGSYSFIIG